MAADHGKGAVEVAGSPAANGQERCTMGAGVPTPVDGAVIAAAGTSSSIPSAPSTTPATTISSTAPSSNGSRDGAVASGCAPAAAAMGATGLRRRRGGGKAADQTAAKGAGAPLASGDAAAAGATDGDTNAAKILEGAPKTHKAKVAEAKPNGHDADDVSVSAREALRFVLPFMVPRTARLRLLVLFAILCEIGQNACTFFEPLLLRCALDGLTVLATAGNGAAVPPDSAATIVAAVTAAPPSPLLLGWGFLPPAVLRRSLLATVGYIAAGYMSGLFSYGHHVAWQRFEDEMLLDLRVDIFSHLHSLSLAWHLNRDTDRVMTIFNLGVSDVPRLISLVSFDAIPMVTQFAVTVAVVGRLGSWSFSALVVVAIAVYAAFTFAQTRASVKRQRAAYRARLREAGRARQSLLHFENVKVFGTEAVEVDRYRDLLERRRDRRQQSSLVMLHHLQSAIRAAFVAMGMVMAGQRVAAGTLSIADFVTLETYLNRIFHPVSYAAGLVKRFTSTLMSVRRLVDLRQLRPDIVDAPGAVPLVLCPPAYGNDNGDGVGCRGGEIVFDNVSFSYGANSAGAIHGVSFTVRAGGTTAIVGPTGSGKTTLMRLVLRLFDATSGRITIDEQDIAGVTQQSLRDAIGVVTQDTLLFRDSVRANIAYGRDGGRNVPDDEVAGAADVAQLTGWLDRLPEGLESVCGERGVRLSGGERQRVGIARVVIRRPGVLLLDESSSALDSETERAMQGALRTASRGATTLIVAHRLSTVVGADEILVLEAGHIVERGTHAALLRRPGGRYRRMWELQHGVEDGGGGTGVAPAVEGAGAGDEGATGSGE
ncbi:hypothetical protein BU14_0171s0022 [Porphyra umbilicalis]|uniref:Probable ATP-dependent transporter ycf16 n=1 Tax=Porphyra umbilicalis TaxID=2786 RepID=A0A1X6P8B8_PORUM|nr:hypothetical protein BU14_0171s0022 [Porphyra umbilicalis]|eukprot:OSX76873.1 hypothetical protein BU14_0171s0022 [Porphyra umbilicalis]